MEAHENPFKHHTVESFKKRLGRIDFGHNFHEFESYIPKMKRRQDKKSEHPALKAVPTDFDPRTVPSWSSCIHSMRD